MNNIEILEEKIKIIESLCTDDCINKSTVIQPLKYAIENLIQENKELRIQISARETVVDKLTKENKELKEKFDVIQRKIYRLEEDNIELLKPKGKDQLNYKYIECPKVEAEWYKSESYIKDNYIPKSKVKEKIEVIQKRMKEETRTDFLITLKILENELQELLEEGE